MAARKAAPIIVKNSFTEGCVGIGIDLACEGWASARAKISASTNLTTEQARMLAQSLIEMADKVDTKAAEKAAKASRRQKWREREVAAGRTKMLSIREFER